MLVVMGDITDPVTPDHHRHRRAPDITARIRFLTTIEGGRRAEVATGYRGGCDLGLPGTHNDALFDFPGRDWLNLGDEVSAEVWILCPELQRGRLFPGFEFTLCEGSRVVARATVTAVHNSSLLRTS